jgi:hypothetical protein
MPKFGCLPYINPKNYYYRRNTGKNEDKIVSAFFHDINVSLAKID